MNGESLIQKIIGHIHLPDEHTMVDLMAGHYQTMHLLNADGSWVSPLLADEAGALLPGSVTAGDCQRFLRRILDLALQNPFLAEFLDAARNEHFPLLEHRLQTEGDRIIPDALAFAMSLERLTKACHENYLVLEACRTGIRKALRQTGAFRRLPLFYKIKAQSVDPVVWSLICAHKRPPEKLGAGSGSCLLQVNILEAALSDLLRHHVDNAKAGWILAMHKPGRRKVDPLTGAGPNFWSADGKTLCLRPPFPKMWADLYQVWNMAFLSDCQDFPYVISKLLIPQVAGYAEHPPSYMNPRVIALYLYLAWFTFSHAERLNRRKPQIQWNDPSLTRFWGKITRRNAIHYEDLVDQSGR
jgi:hypothetical protein